MVKFFEIRIENLERFDSKKDSNKEKKTRPTRKENIPTTIFLKKGEPENPRNRNWQKVLPVSWYVQAQYQKVYPYQGFGSKGETKEEKGKQGKEVY